MDFIVANWVLILAALVSGLMLAWPTLTGTGAATGLSANQAVLLINREKAVVVDVCEAAEYAQGHIAAAKSVPLDQLQARLPEVVKNKALPVILVCTSGARSARAVAIARKLGYEKAYSLGGGLKSWREANLPVVAAQS